MTKYKNIIWDFDGVILMSNTIRELGFRQIFANYKKSEIELLIQYHNLNGGLSRYHKIRYFYEKIRGEEVSDERINQLANLFSEYMRKELISKKFLNNEWLNLINKSSQNINHHIASGSDEIELHFLCKKLEIESYFKSISGSPEIKKILVKNIMQNYNYSNQDTVLIGDSINDFEAANFVNIDFIGYNNPCLIELGNYENNLENLISFFS